MKTMARAVLKRRWTGILAYRKLRHTVLIARVNLLAKWEGSVVHWDLAPDLQLGRGIRVKVWPRTETTVRIGPKSRIGDNVLLHLRGGTLNAGLRTDIRAHCSVQFEGNLTLEGENTISYGCVLHCGESVRLGYAAIMAEYSSIADSTHFHTTADYPIGENVKFEPIEIGRNTFLCPRVSVNRGVTIGPWTVVGPSSVVARDIPAGVFASGVPAKVVRSLGHPWMEDVLNNAPGAPDPETPAWRKHADDGTQDFGA
ncbi:MAG: hypothetical protein QOJ00_2835 [Actinomycetota bacterium]